MNKLLNAVDKMAGGIKISKDEFDKYYDYITSEGKLIFSPNGLKPGIHELTLEDCTVCALDCSEGYTQYINYIVNNIIILSIKSDFYNGLTIDWTEELENLSKFKDLMCNLIDTQKNS